MLRFKRTETTTSEPTEPTTTEPTKTTTFMFVMPATTMSVCQSRMFVMAAMHWHVIWVRNHRRVKVTSAILPEEAEAVTVSAAVTQPIDRSSSSRAGTNGTVPAVTASPPTSLGHGQQTSIP